MRDNTLRQKLYAGQAAFGVMCTFPSPPVVEMLGYLGFDWILLDNEHGSIAVDSAEPYLEAAEDRLKNFSQQRKYYERPAGYVVL